MSIQSDYVAVSTEIATKRARLGFLLDGAEEATGSEAETRAHAIKSANDELGSLVSRAEDLSAKLKLEGLERAALKAMRQPVGRQILPDNEGSYGRSSSPRSAGPDWGDVVVQAAEEQSAARGLKSLLPSGTAVIPVPIGGPIAEPRRARFLTDLMPVEDAPGGHLSYLHQAVRGNNAAVVAEGAIKPTSVYTLELVADTTRVVAHLSEALPRTYFDDSGKIRQFIADEMQLGLDLAVDAKIVTDIYASGLLAEGDIGSTLATCRRAVTRLQEREVEPTAWVFHPRDWEQITGELTATYASNDNVAPPTDEIRRSLYGIPVVVSNAMTENNGLLGDFRKGAALYRTDGVRLDWSEATYDSVSGATDWSRNMLRWRAELRVQTAIYRSFAFISINLAGTGR